MPATAIKKLLRYKEKNLHKSAKKAKTKHLHYVYTVDIVNKIVTIGG